MSDIQAPDTSDTIEVADPSTGGSDGDGAGQQPQHPFTLAVDIGGTGLKASVLGAHGSMVADRVRIPTSYPLPPAKLVADLTRLVAPLPAAERASVGFPGNGA